MNKMSYDRPNIVQKWEKDKTDNKQVSHLWFFKKNDEFNGVSKEDWVQYLKHEDGVREMIGIPNSSNYKFLKLTITGYDSRRCYGS